MPPVSIPPNAAEMRKQLELLYLERAFAATAGLPDNGRYMADLEADISATHGAYVGAAVVEIAIARAALSRPLSG